MSELASPHAAIVLAGTGSNCGKTTLTCAILGALVRQGLVIQPFKCGPDYIDPQHHTRITGRSSRNLDSFLLDLDTLQYLFSRAAQGADLAVVEGVMGYYDGLGGTSLCGSTWQVTQWLGAKAVLVVDCAGMSLSAAAIIRGFCQFVADSCVSGVILNRASSGLYQLLREPIETHTGVRVLGYFPRVPESSFSSRHLGLVTAGEVSDFDVRVERLAAVATETIDLPGLLQLASLAKTTKCLAPPLPPSKEGLGPCRIAVARDEAFCFYYEDNLDLLRQMGAQVVEFSPLRDLSLPSDCAGLYLGGGYPELHAARLEQNESMRVAVKQAADRGMPLLAECGGFLYLLQEYQTTERCYQMTGVIAGSYRLTDRLGHFGYQELVAGHDNLLAKAGTKIRAHEFHYSTSSDDGDDCTASKPGRPGIAWSSVHANASMFAGYPHLHLWSDPQLARNYVDACCRFRLKRLAENAGVGKCNRA